MDKYWEITTSLPNSSNTEVVNIKRNCMHVYLMMLENIYIMN
ncbi:hypothetical protein [Fictibacillus sp. WQ 8-8]|nr:hypothetical protein [Fictibacillus sp. WQ 8-8]